MPFSTLQFSENYYYYASLKMETVFEEFPITIASMYFQFYLMVLWVCMVNSIFHKHLITYCV